MQAFGGEAFCTCLTRRKPCARRWFLCICWLLHQPSHSPSMPLQFAAASGERNAPAQPAGKVFGWLRALPCQGCQAAHLQPLHACVVLQQGVPAGRLEVAQAQVGAELRGRREGWRACCWSQDPAWHHGCPGAPLRPSPEGQVQGAPTLHLFPPARRCNAAAELRAQLALVADPSQPAVQRAKIVGLLAARPHLDMRGLAVELKGGALGRSGRESGMD